MLLNYIDADKLDDTEVLRSIRSIEVADIWLKHCTDIETAVRKILTAQHYHWGVVTDDWFDFNQHLLLLLDTTAAFDVLQALAEKRFHQKLIEAMKHYVHSQRVTFTEVASLTRSNSFIVPFLLLYFAQHDTVRVIRELTALGDNINHTYLGKYALQHFPQCGCGELELLVIVGLGANFEHCKTVVSSYRYREDVLLVAFYYVKFNRAARIIQRAFRRFRKAICTIQREWRHCIANPSRAMCRKRLVSEFAELGVVLLT